MPKVVGDSEVSNSFKTPISTENGSGYNLTHLEQNLIVSTLASIPRNRWPFKHKDETNIEFKNRIKKLKKNE